MSTGSHPNRIGPHPKKKYRIDCLVSEEVKFMWDEIVKQDKRMSKERHYPAHSLERIIRADYEVMRAFGSISSKKWSE